MFAELVIYIFFCRKLYMFKIKILIPISRPSKITQITIKLRAPTFLKTTRPEGGSGYAYVDMRFTNFIMFQTFIFYK